MENVIKEASPRGGMVGAKPVYVCSTGDEVELFLNGKSLGKGKRSDTFLFTFDSVKNEPGTLRAVAYKNGKEVSSDEKHTVGEPVALRMKWIGPEDIQNSLPHREGWSGSPLLADGSDIRICEIEAVDKNGNRHPLAHDMIHFEVSGDGTYLGGVSAIVPEEERIRNAASTPDGSNGITSEGGTSKDTNGVGSQDLMLEAGVIRVMVRTIPNANKKGEICLTATPTGDSKLGTASLKIATVPCPTKNGFYVDGEGKMIAANRSMERPVYLERGETPATPSYTQKYNTVEVESVEAAANKENLHYLTDGIEDGVTNIIRSKWSSDGILDNAWLKVNLKREAEIAQIDIRMDNFRTTSYPLQVFAITDNGARQLVWEGYTYKCLGNCYLNIDKPVKAKSYEIRMVGEATVKEAFASMTELAAKKNVSTKASKSNVLSISEIAFNEKVK